MRVGVIVALVVFCAVFVAVVGGSGDVSGDIGAADDLDVDPDRTVLAIDLDGEGDAVWQIEYRMALTTDEEIEAFDELADEIEADPDAFTDRFRDRMEPTVDAAAESTGRDMAIGEVTVETERRFVDREYGIVTYRFTWSNFAEIDGPDMHAGDAISGLFLNEDTSLVIRWESDYALLDVTPSPDAEGATSVRWAGPRDFGSTEPRLIVSTDAPAFGLSPTDPLTWVIFFGLVSVLLAGVGLSRYLNRRRERGETEISSSPPTDELLSNEERVVRLIEANGGRMKQQAVAEELDWTDAKTSKVARSLRDAGDLEGFRIGRENILRLPDEDETGDDQV